MNSIESNHIRSKLGKQLHSNTLAKAGELILIFLIAFVFIKLISPLAWDNPVLKQAIVWVANVIMLILVWAGLKLRGENWKDFGLSLKFVS